MKKLLVLTVALIVSSGAGAATAKAPEALQPAGPASQVRPSTRTPAENRWLTKMAKFSKTLGEALNTIGEMLSDPATVQRLLLGDQDELFKLIIPLVTLQTSPATFHKSVGRPPTRRLVRLYNLLNRACGHFKLTALLFERGFDHRDPATIRRANAEMLEGTRLIRLATAELKHIK